jgi:hypothetical protein
LETGAKYHAVAEEGGKYSKFGEVGRQAVHMKVQQIEQAVRNRQRIRRPRVGPKCPPVPSKVSANSDCLHCWRYPDAVLTGPPSTSSISTGTHDSYADRLLLNILE